MASGGRNTKVPKTSASEPKQRSSWHKKSSTSDKDDNASLNSFSNDLRPNNWTLSNEGDKERNNERNLLRRQENLPGYPRQDVADVADGHFSRPVSNRRDDHKNRNNNKQNHNNSRTTSAASSEKTGSSQIVGRLMQIRDYKKLASSMMESLTMSGDPSGSQDEMKRLQKLMDHLKEQERGYTDLLQALLSVSRDESDVNDLGRGLTPNLEPPEDEVSMDLEMNSEVSDREERSISASSRPQIEDKLGLTSDNDDDDVEEEVPSESSENSSTMVDTVITTDRNQEWNYELGESELTMGGAHTTKKNAKTLIALRQQQELLQKLLDQQQQMQALRDRQTALLALQKDAEDRLAAAKQKSHEARSVSNALEEAASAMTNRVDRLTSVECNAARPADPELLDIRQQLQYLRNELKTQSPTLEQVHSLNRPSNVAINISDVRVKNQPPPRPSSPKLARESSKVRVQAVKGQTSGQQLVREIPPAEMTREQHQLKLQELVGKQHQIDQLLQAEFSAPLLSGPTDHMDKDQLQDKLLELQAKKRRMDHMLQELQTLKTSSALLLNNAAAPIPAASGITPVQGTDNVTASTQGTDNFNNGVPEVLDARQKLQKLNEVKGRLGQLKTFVNFYESAEGPVTGGHSETEDQPSFQPPHSNSADQEHTEVRGSERYQQARQKAARSQVNIPVRTRAQEESEENNSSKSAESSSSDSESQLSSLGPWGDDPEIQEKVKKLKAAKEKLKHLQNLAAMVQHSPEIAEELPDNLAELAPSVEDVESQLTQAEERNNVSVSEGEVPLAIERELYYQTQMGEQLAELEQLKNEKTRLLTIQAQLQSLHGRFQQLEAVRQKGNQSAVSDQNSTKVTQPTQPKSHNQKEVQNQQTPGPSVSFSSNEEVYNKMRNQCMLREELREKKKQLESIMKKDRNKKQYYRNQDNQSDTVSYSTEMFGAAASVDQTIATWGGSTVDNLESITEDGADNAQNNEDDAFPSDGILQVEEEEEQNQSDYETYTIEEDVRQRRKARAMAKSSGDAEGKGKQSFPRPSAQERNRRMGGAGPKESLNKPTDFNKWSRNGGKSRQENYRSAEDIIDENEVVSKESKLDKLQCKVEELSQLCQSLLVEKQLMGQSTRLSATGYGCHSQMSELQQQLQHQQLIMSLNQCYQQMSLQQIDMQNMQRQLQALLHQHSDNPDNEIGVSTDMKEPSMQPVSSLYPRQSPSLLMPRDAFAFNPVYPNLTPNSNRLLRSAADLEQSYHLDGLGDGLEQQPHGARVSRSDSYQQRSVRKSLSPQPLNNSAVSRSKTNAIKQTVDNFDEDRETRRFTSDRKKFEDYLTRKKNDLLKRNRLLESDQSQILKEGQRKSSKSKLGGSEQYSPLHRPGLSADVSVAGYQDDGNSGISSAQSSIAAAIQANEVGHREAGRYSDGDDTQLSLFETLREPIYSEVATLISQNENRPHFLIELFRELQLLTTDYLRQRVLYDIKDVVSKYLVEDASVSAPAPSWMNTVVNRCTNTKLTPSKSNLTSDDEVTRLKQKVAANLVAKERENAGQLLRSGSMKNEEYDYQEQAEVTSSVSTLSNSCWTSPFNQDSLGESAIHLDKTLEKMKEYETKLTAKKEKGKVLRLQEGYKTEEVGSSAMEQGDYPRIDTQQLDQEIKSFITEVIPVIKKHMDNICSPQLLAYINQLVLSLTCRYDNGQEFSRFFHRQLASILHDTLAKYEGRKMRECGEDLLVDLSEVLLNELAFYRLMQDCDNPLIAKKMKAAEALFESEEEKANNDKESESESGTSESSSNDSDNQDDIRPTSTEEEDLDKSRDDEFAIKTEIQYTEDKDYDLDSPYNGFQVELVQSETKPYTRIGSDEDDESAADESQSVKDPSETAVSIDACRTCNPDDTVGKDDVKDKKDSTNVADMKVGQTNTTIQQDQIKDADPGTGSRTMEALSTEYVNISIEDIEVITMDDLPPSLTLMSSEEFQMKLIQEQQNNSGASAILGTVDGHQELAGDPQFLKEPEKESG